MEVRAARDADEVAAALALRERVFCGEQGVAVEAERDGSDREALHVVAVEGDRVVGTCRVVFRDDVARLGRMAVEREARGSGIGSAVLACAEACARAAGARKVALHAQTYVRDLYAARGYVAHGDAFVEEGIDHVAMEKALDDGAARA